MQDLEAAPKTGGDGPDGDEPEPGEVDLSDAAVRKRLFRMCKKRADGKLGSQNGPITPK